MENIHKDNLDKLLEAAEHIEELVVDKKISLINVFVGCLSYASFAYEKKECLQVVDILMKTIENYPAESMYDLFRQYKQEVDKELRKEIEFLKKDDL